MRIFSGVQPTGAVEVDDAVDRGHPPVLALDVLADRPDVVAQVLCQRRANASRVVLQWRWQASFQCPTDTVIRGSLRV
ncbi:MAG: hypothetical protein AVDCRST_MAG53-150 [uncultured Solirubrobacteraceae bacterium]|uniref:Uncharacterized protein n=1 Tax=uncultured Solirubrobacteraceae bacterium TaxID=1162706 RepID=A0A6J4RIN9_9ACTN|nr:MAG: hypothetical protein AVDCRST_MAG53-150 [uncultured Solirubrobacteraceae bacterium]